MGLLDKASDVGSKSEKKPDSVVLATPKPVAKAVAKAKPVAKVKAAKAVKAVKAVKAKKVKTTPLGLPENYDFCFSKRTSHRMRFPLVLDIYTMAIVTLDLDAIHDDHRSFCTRRIGIEHYRCPMLCLAEL